MDADSRNARIDDLASELSVKSDDVIEMEARVKAREWSLNETVGDEKEISAMDMLEDHAPNQEMMLIEKEDEKELSTATKQALKKLDPRERFIVTKRFMDDSPWTLQKLGDHFGTSREHVRQLEKRALTKLRKEFPSDLVEGLAEA